MAAGSQDSRDPSAADSAVCLCVPKFGNWEEENQEDVPYTVYFENAGSKPKLYPDADLITFKNYLKDGDSATGCGSPRQLILGSTFSSNRSERKPLDAPLRNHNATRRSTHDSPKHCHGGATSARAGGKGTAMSSPSWERKGLSEDVAPSTPGRSRLRSVTKADETPDNSPAIPKFGDWDESDPASGEGYSQIFSRVREEKHSIAGKVPMMPTEASYINGQKRIATATSKGCGCFPWSR